MKALQILVSVVLGSLLLVQPAAQARDVRLADGTVVAITEYAASGDSLLLWLPSGIPGASAELALGENLRPLGIEVWRADVLEARFLPTLESSLEQVPDSDIAGLIDAARATGKRVTLMASARAAVLAMRGAQAWQRAHPGAPGLNGVVLLHPNLYLGPPDPGQEAEFHPIVASFRLPVYILQPEKSPWRFRLDALKAALEQGGAPVTVRVLPDVRDRFYFRADSTEDEAAETTRLPQHVQAAMQAMHSVSTKAPVTASVVAKTTVTATRTRGLLPYRGDPNPPPLQLQDLDGHAHDLSRLRGRVVLINFWASWCPPCVREMPSMQRLQVKLADRPFSILAVNMAESDQEVRAFLKRVPVEFPLLMDRDGSVLKRWKVFVFPTSFVLGPDGQIRLGVFGEVEWDSPDVVEKISALLPLQP